MSEVTRTQVRAMRDEQEQLLAEHGLAAERITSAFRLGLQLLRIAVYPIVLLGSGEHTHLQENLPRAAVLVLYTGHCLVTFIAVRRTTANIRMAMLMPFVLITADFGFVAAMAFTPSPVDLALGPQIAAASCFIFLSFAALRLRPAHVVYSSVCASVVLAAVCFYSLHRGIAVEPLVIAFTYVTFAVMTALLLLLSRRIREMFTTLRTRDNLRRFLPKQVADRIEKSSMRALDPVKREVTILFSDIRDFTSLSETMDPQKLLELLDDYFGRMSQVVQARGGTVGKFIGDGMLCFWGVPEDDVDHASNAVHAALDMRTVVAELNQERTRAALPALRIGVGVHTGIVAAGELGGKGAGLHEYTVIGDAVNLASRIEGLTKQFQVDILVSDRTWAALTDRFGGTCVGEEKVKGRQETVRVHAIRERTVAAGSALA